VNNAGMEKKAMLWDVTEEDYDKVMAVNLKGPFFATQAFVRRLREAKKTGAIINISSVHEDMAFLHEQRRNAYDDARSVRGAWTVGNPH
jgi:glucose 1-dehydrogenase